MLRRETHFIENTSCFCDNNFTFTDTYVPWSKVKNTCKPVGKEVIVAYLMLYSSMLVQKFIDAAVV